jgi:hypothetical protein
MTALTRIWLTASTMLALLVLASPSYAADSTYEPFVTDFPQGAHGSPTAAPAAGGFDWEAAGAIGVGVVALGALLAALLLTRRHRRVAVALGED